jgi:hypothetical protein
MFKFEVDENSYLSYSDAMLSSLYIAHSTHGEPHDATGQRTHRIVFFRYCDQENLDTRKDTMNALVRNRHGQSIDE